MAFLPLSLICILTLPGCTKGGCSPISGKTPSGFGTASALVTCGIAGLTCNLSSNKT